MVSVVFLITGLLLIGYIGLLLYYRAAWKQIPVLPMNPVSDLVTLPFISVIIAARNEEKNILALLGSLQKQNYPSQLFEIIIVDDGSTDQTKELVLQHKNDQIRVVPLQLKRRDSVSYKKMAIEQGIAAAKGDLIVTTDADCTMLENWLSCIGSYYAAYHPKMIVMPVMIGHGNKMLDVFQSIDFTTMQGITGAAVYTGFHGMCNGANLAYQKDVFIEVDGFSGIDHIASGDDMLLLEKISLKHKNGIAYLKSPDVVVKTAPAEDLRAFIHQRLRWGGKTNHYKDKKLIAVLFFVFLLNVFVLLTGIISLIDPKMAIPCCSDFYFSQIAIVLLLVKTLVEMYLFFLVSRFFKNTALMLWFPFLQPLHILYIVLIGGLGRWISYEWKGRKSVI